MRTTWTTTISAGITASLAIVLFMVLIPQLLGLGTIDITKDLGTAFSTSSPHLAGAVFLAALGIIWSAVFGVLYNSLPGNAITKGAIFGLIVGLFSQSVMPNIMTTLDGIFGATGAYTATAFTLDTTTIVTLVAYVVFGLTLALSTKPSENAI
jgi:hypothetical protein